MFEHIRGDWANFAGMLSKICFFQNGYFDSISWVPRRFFKISINYKRNSHFNFVFFRNFWKVYAYAELTRNDFIAHWAYEETISSQTESTSNEFSRRG